jgi:phosphoribosylformylglycinamidine (FGAM) synthase-like amidotransferase family enzyme
MMPHPERTCQPELKLFGLNNSAMKIFDSLIAYIKKISS